jgi:hypothetical protein
MENIVKKIVIATGLLAVLVGAAASIAQAACPPGTTYNCYPTYNGKMSCGCR